MTSQDDTSAIPRRGRADKRDAIMRASRRVFGRDGYARTSIDAIAAEAGVSTRTIYNHFEGKEQLFSTALQDSATQVAEHLIRVLDHHLGDVTDLEGDLIALGRAWTSPQVDFADHFAMVRQIQAEAPHFPRHVLEAWQQAGPRRAERVLAGRLRLLADRGLLRIDDEIRAARHFVLLVAAEVTQRSYFGAIPLDDAEITEIVTSGVRAFLHGHLPSPPHPGQARPAHGGEKGSAGADVTAYDAGA